ncbi:MAG: tetratricopeptide repeat protein [FCB group bacterium]|nr:tetratricopeptide repeat protein [FCB group bacterium]
MTSGPGDQVSVDISTQNTRWVEFTAHLSQFNRLTVPETREQLELLLKNEHDPAKLASVYTGLSRCYVGEGDFIRAADILGQAYSMLDDSDRDTQAFVLLEMVAFLAIIDNHDKSLLVLNNIPMLTKSKYLLNLAKYYRLVHLVRDNKKNVIYDLIDSARYFEEIDSYGTLAYHYKNIGNAYRVNRQFDEAMTYYQRGIEIVEEHGLNHIKAAIYHDIGMWKFHQGDFEGSIQTLLQTESIADSYFTRSFALANIAYLYLHKTLLDLSIDYFKRSLDIAVKNGVIFLIPGICYYLGTLSEKQKDLHSAEKYYHQAYLAANELIDHNFECRGDIKRAIQAYVPFLIRHPHQTQAESLPRNKMEFEFAVNKTFREIRGIFQSSLFRRVLQNSASKTEGIKKLGLAQRTFYTVRERTAGFQDQPIPAEVDQFIAKYHHLPWKEINQKFEALVVSYLYATYDHNKKKLAEKLNISYPGVLQLTARMKSSL